jgi:Ca2+-binding EF-hand superfamily protein
VTRRRVAWVLVGAGLLLGACGGSAKKAASTSTTAKTSTAHLAVPGTFLRESFDKSDSNHDGVISAAEKDATVKADYASMDVNHDGAVTVDDIKSQPPPGVKSPDQPLDRYLEFDYDHNGRIDSAEYERHVKERFGSMHTSREGNITWPDVVAFYTSRPTKPATPTTRSDIAGGGAALLIAPFFVSRRLRRAAIAAGVVGTVLLSTATPARASMVYNQISTLQVRIAFSCGVLCGGVQVYGAGTSGGYPNAGIYYVDDYFFGCENPAVDGQIGVSVLGASVLQITPNGQGGQFFWTDYVSVLDPVPHNVNITLQAFCT